MHTSFLWAAVFAASAPMQGDRYEITLIPTPTEAPYARAVAINSHGHVAGTYTLPNGTQHGWYWDGQTLMRILPPSGFSELSVNDLNDHGWVVGTLRAASNSHQPRTLVAFVWNPADGMQVLPANHIWSTARGENNHGVVCGSSFMEATLWRNGVMSILPRPCHRDWFAATQDISDSGAIIATCGMDVISHAYLYSLEGDVVWLAGMSMANAVNEAATVVAGTIGETGRTSPAAWRNGALQQLPGLGVHSFGAAMDLNEHGDIVGYVSGHALLWRRDGRVMDLNQHIPSGTGWSLLFAAGINDAGQIAGFGRLKGVERAFLLTPE